MKIETTPLSRRRLLAGVPAVAAVGVPSVATALGGLAEAAEPTITHEQLAAQDFEPVPEFVGLSDAVKKIHEQKLDDVSIVSRMSLHLLGLTKAEIIKNMREMALDTDMAEADEMLQTFVNGRELAECLVEMITAAEVRFASAMANVYAEDGSLKH
jgi:hypothetical protein